MKNFGLALAALALVACGSPTASAPNPSSSSTQPAVESPSAAPLTKQTIAELGINVMIPLSHPDALSTLRFDKQALTDLKDQTGCTDAVMISFTSETGMNYPLGAMYTCTNTMTLSGTDVLTKNNARIVFQPAIEKPIGLEAQDSETYDSMLNALNSPTTYSAN